MQKQKVAKSKISTATKESNIIITIADRMNNNSIQAERLLIEAVDDIYNLFD
jgi:hypothetical protein